MKYCNAQTIGDVGRVRGRSTGGVDVGEGVVVDCIMLEVIAISKGVIMLDATWQFDSYKL